jgi:hypothetical protein
MPTKREPLHREWLPARFSEEVVGLFAELNATSRRRRKAPEFIAKSKRLGILLGLSDAWWMMLHVENANVLRPCPTLAAYEWWPRVQAVRVALLEALKRSAREARPVDQKAFPAP